MFNTREKFLNYISQMVDSISFFFIKSLVLLTYSIILKIKNKQLNFMYFYCHKVSISMIWINERPYLAFICNLSPVKRKLSLLFFAYISYHLKIKIQWQQSLYFEV